MNERTRNLQGFLDERSEKEVADLASVMNELARSIREMLDHRLLNEVEGLGKPTLENLARFIFQQARAALPEVSRGRLRRPSYGQSCVY